MKINPDYPLFDERASLVVFLVVISIVSIIVNFVKRLRRKRRKGMAAAAATVVDKYLLVLNQLKEETFTNEQLDEMISVLKMKQLPDVSVVAASSSSQSDGQGWLYAYQLTWVDVQITDSHGRIDDSWILVKVGRSDPKNIQGRLQDEARLLSGDRQRLPVKFRPAIPVIPPTTSQNYYADAHRNWQRHTDLLFLFNCDTGKEAEYRHYPTGVGVEIGTGRFAEQPTDMNLEWCTAGLKVKAKALRAWILGMSMNVTTAGGVTPKDVTTESLGESEWVVMPRTVADYVKLAQITTEDEYKALMKRVYVSLSGFDVKSVTLTLVDRLDHKSLTLIRPMKLQWPSFSLPPQ